MISVIIPALNEARTIGYVVERVLHAANVTEVIVVDDGSIDGTADIAARAGAKVVTSRMLGKGASMEDGCRCATNEYLVFLDGDLDHFCDDLIARISAPLTQDQADLVKARFSRSGGRVTELSAKPLLNLFFPELASVFQPLGGIIAIRKDMLLSLSLENDYGADVGLLIDVYLRGGRIRQVDIGHVQHDSQPLENLRGMAHQVTRAILERAGRLGRLSEAQLSLVREQDRIAKAGLVSLLRSLGTPKKIAFLDMDGTLMAGRFAVELAKRANRTSELEGLLENSQLTSEQRTRRIASVFSGIPQQVFLQVASQIPLAQGAVELVVGLRKRGYSVGIVSDSFFIAAEVCRKRVFADFCAAHVMHFENGVATGEVTLAQAMSHSRGCRRHEICKSNLLRHIVERTSLDLQTIAVGDNEGDICLLRSVDISIAFEPKTEAVANSADYCLSGNLAPILGYVDREYLPIDAMWTNSPFASRIGGDGI